MCLSEVQDYKVQEKWGDDILQSFVDSVQDQETYDYLFNLLQEEMDKINEQHQQFKQQQRQQMAGEYFSPNKNWKNKQLKNSG